MQFEPEPEDEWQAHCRNVVAMVEGETAPEEPVMAGEVVRVEAEAESEPVGASEVVPEVMEREAPAESIEIQVPEGAAPGATLEFQLDDGRTIDFTVPDGARAGDRLQVPVPPLSPSAGPDGDAADWDEGPDDLDEIEEME